MPFKEYRPSQNYQLKSFEKSSENDKCIIRMSMCDENKFQLHNLKARDLKDFSSFIKKVENMVWQEIRTYNGLKYEVLNNIGYKVPDNIPNDISLCSMRVNQKFRVIGYREGVYFFIIWFDSGHKTC